ncbi:MAG: hypothetical protein E7672_01780 [Ruminococcaceae bacterium]|nr:hypothetical protein [Oscillospiraceae bacterium]
MKTSERTKEIAVLITVVVLFLLLIGLTYALIYMRNMTNMEVDVPFELEMLTADQNADKIDISKYLLPEFIGITADGEQMGISGYINTTAEIYKTLSPLIAETFGNGFVSESDESKWKLLSETDGSVYIRYHSTLPDNIIAMFARSAAGITDEDDKSEVSAYIYEMFILSHSGNSGQTEIAVKDTDGNVFVFRKTKPRNLLTNEDLSEIIRSYRSSMTEFVFAGDEYPGVSVTEPVFIRPVYARNILITGNTSVMVENSAEEFDKLLRVFDFNPDKLLNSHINDELGAGTYIDTHGVFNIGESEFEYNAADGGGISIRHLIGYSKKYGLSEYIRAAISIHEKIRDINSFYAGGDAEIALSRINAVGNKVTLEFSYYFDNYRIVDLPCAVSVTFEGDKLLRAELYTIAAKNLGTRTESMSEKWYIGYMTKNGTVAQNTSLVYRSDFISESISAVWASSVKKNSTNDNDLYETRR